MACRSRRRGEAAEGHAEAIHKALMEARPAGVEMPQVRRSPNALSARSAPDWPCCAM